jgi:hypothetical protein
MASGFDFKAFPVLKINGNDIPGSWNSWLSEFELCVEMTTIKMGKEEVENEQLDKFRGRLKLLALANAIGKDGRDALQSVGFDLKDNDATYEQAMARLKEIYERTESVYVKTMKFVTVSQANGEDEREYLLRVEKLSRTMDFGANNNDLRERLALALAVNGLRESSLRRQLMQETDLTWERLTNTLRARHSARESEALLKEVKSGHSNVKQEVKHEVDAIDSRSRFRERKWSDSSDNEESERHKRNTRPYRRSRSSSRSSWSGSDKNQTFSPEWKRKGNRGNRDSYEWPRRRRNSRSPRRERSPGYGRSSRRYTSSEEEELVCFHCNKVGHHLRQCPKITCYICRERGHTSVDCKVKGKKRSKYERYDRRYRSNSSGSSRSPRRRVRFSESKSPS